ncbi:hypothetical protein [Escherichia coli]|uniref:hypothetical protein n=1 Tax=Escherichia coli TaxID=562 RepID=UPI00106731D3|nr:hypothetical protein [Escherichia coli]
MFASAVLSNRTAGAPASCAYPLFTRLITRVDILGTVSVTGTDSTGIDIEGNNASLNIGKDARLSVQSSGNAWGEERESVLFDVEGDNLSIVQASQDFSVGQYGTGINAEAENGGKILQTGRMTIAGTGATGISIESEGAIKGVQAINQGELLVENGGTGMKASGRNAVLINSGNRRIITICNQFAGNIESDIPPFCQNGRCVTSGSCCCAIQNIHLYGFPGHNNGSLVPAIEHGIFVNHKATVISSIGKRADTGNSILRLFTEINFCSVYNGIPRATLTTVPFINHPLRSALRPDTI